jgi:hypothetical protein
MFLEANRTTTPKLNPNRKPVIAKIAGGCGVMLDTIAAHHCRHPRTGWVSAALPDVPALRAHILERDRGSFLDLSLWLVLAAIPACA